MWHTVLTYFGDAFNFVTDLLTTTIAFVLLIFAIVAYIYTIFDVRIPKLLAIPVVAIPLAVSLAIYSYLYTRDYQQALCNQAAIAAKSELEARTLKAALDIKKVQDALIDTRINLAAAQAERSTAFELAVAQEVEKAKDEMAKEQAQQDALEAAIKANEQPPLAPESDANVPTPTNKPVVIYTSCLQQRVPTSILRAFNVKGGASVTGKP